MTLPEVCERSLARLAVGVFMRTLALQLGVPSFSATQGWEGGRHPPVIVALLAAGVRAVTRGTSQPTQVSLGFSGGRA